MKQPDPITVWIIGLLTICVSIVVCGHVYETCKEIRKHGFAGAARNFWEEVSAEFSGLWERSGQTIAWLLIIVLALLVLVFVPYGFGQGIIAAVKSFK